jgi:hypothetical protein
MKEERRWLHLDASGPDQRSSRQPQTLPPNDNDGGGGGDYMAFHFCM